MANTKISQLPIWSGTAADLRWFVMNNSGQTETFRFSGYTSQLVPGTAANSYRTINATAASGTNSMALGNASSATGESSFAVGGGTANGASSFAGPGGSANGGNAVAFGPSTTNNFNAFTCGYLNQSNGNGSATFGIFARADSDCSYAIGENVRAYNKGQFSKSGGAFGTQGDSQQTLINTSKSASIGSVGATILSTFSNGGAGDIELLGTNRLFKVKCLWATMVSVSGGGGSDPIVGDVFAQELDFTFKKVGGVLTQVGTTTTTSTENDASMTGASLTLSVSSNKLRITFNAPTTTGNNTYNTNACLYITEVAF